MHPKSPWLSKKARYLYLNAIDEKIIHYNSKAHVDSMTKIQSAMKSICQEIYELNIVSSSGNATSQQLLDISRTQRRLTLLKNNLRKEAQRIMTEEGVPAEEIRGGVVTHFATSPPDASSKVQETKKKHR